MNNVFTARFAGRQRIGFLGLLLAAPVLLLVMGCGSDQASTAHDSGAGDKPGEWPAKKITLYGPDAESGTFDYFTEEIVGETKSCREDYNPSANDNQLVRGVQQDRYALGYFGLAYYEENKDSLKLIGVDSGAGPVQPTMETVMSNAYAPLSRPLFIYVNNKLLADPAGGEFISFYLKKAAAIAPEVGYVSAPADTGAENLKAFQEAGGVAGTGGDLSGKITIAGSSTVYPISEAMSVEFREVAPDVKVIVKSTGTGGGMSSLAAGEIDICDASRPMKEKEAKLCEENGVEFTKFVVAFDGIAVVVNKENSWCDSLTVEQLKKLWQPEGHAETWADLAP